MLRRQLREGLELAAELDNLWPRCGGLWGRNSHSRLSLSKRFLRRCQGCLCLCLLLQASFDQLLCFGQFPTSLARVLLCLVSRRLLRLELALCGVQAC